MAPGQLDPQTLTSWEDAFQYPIPAIRKLEAQLRIDIVGNKDRLRTLVGASYRELLGTADTIIHMDEQIHAVESTLTSVGRNCNSSILEKKNDSVSRLQHVLAAQGYPNIHPLASQLSLLHKCSRTIARILRNEGPVLLAAKILVISRLVHKSISSKKNAPPFLETLRNKLASQRRNLLRFVDKQLASTDSGPDSLAQSMCAFCLATSSSSSDALRHFLHVQLEGIRGAQTTRDTDKDIIQPLKVYIRTQQITRTFFPRRLSEALASFRSSPLILHSDVSQLEALDLQVHGRWIEDEVRNFTPWIKSDNLSRHQIDQIVRDWESQAFGALLAGLSSSVEGVTDFRDLLNIRKTLIETWLPFHQELLSSSSDVLTGLRSVINAQLVTQIQARANQLDIVGSGVRSVLDSWHNLDEIFPRSLWEESLTLMDFSHGAAKFKQEMQKRYHGRNIHVTTVFNPYQDRLSALRDMESAIQDLKTEHWENCFDNEDDSTIESVLSLLNTEDPSTLEHALRENTIQCFHSLQRTFHEKVLPQISPGNDSDKIVFLLRIIREIRQSMPGWVETKMDFCTDIVKKLHSALAIELLRPLMASFTTSIVKMLNNKRVVGKLLWEGEPPLPVQPSPTAFRLLKKVVHAMAARGIDIWSPAAVIALKSVMASNVASSLQALVRDHSGNRKKEKTTENEPMVNGLKSVSKTENNEGSDVKDEGKDDENNVHDSSSIVNGAEEKTNNEEGESHGHHINAISFQNSKLIQLLFDAYYLLAALGGGKNLAPLDASEDPSSTPNQTSSSSSPSPSSCATDLKQFTDKLATDYSLQMKETEIQRLRKSAVDYWGRTALLFGSLSISS